MTTSVRQMQAARDFERQELEAVTKSAAAQLAKTQGALIAATDKQVKDFWGNPIRELATVEFDQFGFGTDERLEAKIADSTVINKSQVAEAFKKFTKILNGKGFTMSAEGRSRLTGYLYYQKVGRNIDLHDVQNIVNAWDRLYQCGAFADDEIGWDASLVQAAPPAPAPAPAPAPEDLSKIDIETIPVSGSREAEARAKKIVREQYVTSFIGPLVGQWIDSLKSEPWNCNLTEQQWLNVVRRLENLFTQQNLAIVPKSFDLARRVFTKDGTLPPGLITEDEALSERIELSTLTNNRSARLEFVVESRKLRGLGA